MPENATYEAIAYVAGLGVIIIGILLSTLARVMVNGIYTKIEDCSSKIHTEIKYIKEKTDKNENRITDHVEKFHT